MKERRRYSLLPWLRLVRLPNLFTAFGDSLAGFCIASTVAGVPLSLRKLLLLPLCSVLFYAAGIIINDWHDVVEDRRHNPDRPLAAGLISPTAALTVAIVMVLAALGISLLLGRWTFLVASLLLVMILSYNCGLKKFTNTGAISMGICRVLNLLLGAAAVMVSVEIVIPAIALFIYIMCVTYLAEGENRIVQIPDRNVFYPAIIFAVGWIASAFTFLRTHFSDNFPTSLACAAFGTGAAFFAGVMVYNKSIRPQQAHAFIGNLINALIPMQASYIVISFPMYGIPVMVSALLLWMGTMLLGKVLKQS